MARLANLILAKGESSEGGVVVGRLSINAYDENDSNARTQIVAELGKLEATIE